MRTLTKPAALLCLPLLLFVGCISPAAAQTARFRVIVSWTLNEIEPKQKSRSTSSTYLVTLHGGKSVSEQVTRQFGRRARDVRQSTREAALGEDQDRRFPTQWKVVNETTLLRLSGRRSHTFAIWLRTDGSRSCSVTAEWRLKPGHSVYETWAPGRKVKMLFTEPTDQRTSCEVL